VTFVVAIAVGVALIATLLATSQLSASSATDEAVALTAPRLPQPSLRQMRVE
jgi:hypothetical protein